MISHNGYKIESTKSVPGYGSFEVTPSKLAPYIYPISIPLSFSQLRLFALTKDDSNDSFYNVPIIFYFSGLINSHALSKAIDAVVERHDVFRTTFPYTDGMPHQHIEQNANPLNLQPEMVLPEILTATIQSAASKGFDLSKDFPFRARLFEVPAIPGHLPAFHILLLVIHNYIFDVMSLGPLCDDISHAYASYLINKVPTWDNLELQYSDYTLLQHKMLDTSLNPYALTHYISPFWTNALDRLSHSIRLWKRPDCVIFSRDNYKCMNIRINSGVHRRLLDLARSRDASLLAVLHAAVVVLFARLGAPRYFPMGIVVSGRDHKPLSRLVGTFDNILVCCIDAPNNSRVIEVLGQILESYKCARDYQSMPFEQLRRMLTPEQRSAIHQVAISCHSNLRSTLSLPGVISTITRPLNIINGFDIIFDFAEQCSADNRPEGIECKIIYHRDIFQQDTIRPLADNLAAVITTASNATNIRGGSHLSISMHNTSSRDGAIPVPEISSHVMKGSRNAAWRQEYVAPRDPLQLRLVQIWEKIFDVSRIGTRDSFCDLGGNQQLFMKLVAAIENTFGKSLAFAFDFREATVERLGNAMADQMPRLPIIEAQSGDSGLCTPLFFFHGDIYGGGWYGFEFMRGLEPDRPFYMLQPHGINGLRKPGTIESMAEDFIPHLLKIQPHGPYCLAGYCNGALTAMEMANILVKEGQTILLLALIEGPLSTTNHKISNDRMPLIGTILSLANSDRRSSHLSRIERAMRLYSPKPYSGKIHLFKACDSWIRNDTSAWLTITRDLDVHSIPGDHKSCICQHSTELAAKINSLIVQAEGRTPKDIEKRNKAGRTLTNP